MNTLVTFTILLSCFAGLNALTCQLCSILNSDCSDPSMGSYSGNYSVACSSNDNACSKLVVKLDGKVTTTTRSCSSSCDEKCVSASTLETCQYCCTTDDCNGASTLTFSLVTALAAVVFGALAAHGV